MLDDAKLRPRMPIDELRDRAAGCLRSHGHRGPLPAIDTMKSAMVVLLTSGIEVDEIAVALGRNKSYVRTIRSQLRKHLRLPPAKASPAADDTKPAHAQFSATPISITWLHGLARKWYSLQDAHAATLSAQARARDGVHFLSASERRYWKLPEPDPAAELYASATVAELREILGT